MYYDRLTTAGRKFIDTRRLLRAIGFGLLDPRLIKDVLFRPHQGKPVLNLPYLLKTTLQETKRLDWDKFAERQDVQPLKLVASGLKSEDSVVMDYASVDTSKRSKSWHIAYTRHACFMVSQDLS